MIRFLPILLFITLFSCSARQAEPLAGARADADAVERILDGLTTREKIAQMMHVWAYGEYQADDSDRFRRVERLVREEKIGGFIFSRGDIYDQAILTNKLQAISEIPLWISQDMEFGAAMRINGTTRFTPAMGVAATGDPAHAYNKGWVTAMEAKAIGVHQVFAPVLDVNNNPANPVINVRSFGADPRIVTEFGLAFIKGIRDAGLVPTVKHFPGHGDTAVDSHIGLPVIAHDWARLDSVELVPFRAAIRDGIESVMSAHIAFPKLGTDATRPGTLDRNILTGILRDSLGFTGLTTTDALEMEAVSTTYSPGEAIVMAINAGADMLLIPPDVTSGLDAAVAAVERGDVSIADIDASVRKILVWKRRMGLFERKPIDIDALSALVNNRDYQRMADAVSQGSITVLRNEGGILPIRSDRFRRIHGIAMADDRTGTTGSGLATRLRDYHPDVRFSFLDERTTDDEIDRLVRRAGEADLIVIGSFVFVKTSSGKIGLTDRQTEVLRRLEGTGKPVVLVSFGNPYIANDLPDAEVQMLAWAATQPQINAAVNALFGTAEVSGRMPVPIPGGTYGIGAGLSLPKVANRPDAPETVGLSADSLRRIARIMDQAIRDSVFPGATVTVLKDGILAYEGAFGYHDYTKRKRVRQSDVFDLASISKVAGTTLAVMKLVDEGRLRLDDPISMWIPEYRSGDKAAVTIRHFLTHTSGLPPFRVYVDSLRTKDAILAAIRREALTYTTGTEYRYSDLGMILLGTIVEEIAKEPLDAYLRKTFYQPLGMNSTMYNPLRRGAQFFDRILPTEHDTVYRKAWVHGQVHDERAFYLDGVAGHAGLFGNGRDLAVFAQLLLNGGTYGGVRYLKPETVALFTARTDAPGRRALGFDMKSLSGFTSAGAMAGSDTFGHTGFTGTSIWMDPGTGITVIILTNRTYPYRKSAGAVGRVRAEVGDQVRRSLVK